jgi:hypothetical protein
MKTNKALHNLCSSLNVRVRPIASMKMVGVGHVACMGAIEMHRLATFQLESLKEGDHLGEISVGGRIILKYIFKQEVLG